MFTAGGSVLTVTDCTGSCDPGGCLTKQRTVESSAVVFKLCEDKELLPYGKVTLPRGRCALLITSDSLLAVMSLGGVGLRRGLCGQKVTATPGLLRST